MEVFSKTSPHRAEPSGSPLRVRTLCVRAETRRASPKVFLWKTSLRNNVVKSLGRHPFRAYSVGTSVMTGVPLVIFLLGLALYTSRAVLAHPLLAMGYLAGFGMLAYWSARLLLARASVVVGNDGMTFEGSRHNAFPRFVPWSNVKSIERHEDSVIIERTKGAALQIERLADSLSLLRDAKEHLARYEKRGPMDVPAVLLEEAISEGGYRDVSVPPQILVRVIEEPTADVEIRAFAAELAMKAGEAERVREVAELTAEPDLRRYLKKLTRSA